MQTQAARLLANMVQSGSVVAPTVKAGDKVLLSEFGGTKVDDTVRITPMCCETCLLSSFPSSISSMVVLGGSCREALDTLVLEHLSEPR